jgi:MoxR-like ATPase
MKNTTIRILPKARRTFKAEDYIMHEALKNAVEIAIALGQPLLLTGEPGTGKTKLAYKIAHDLAALPDANFENKPLIFNTKTTSSARDLFYTYDALSHFQAANVKKDDGSTAARTADFIELQALGKAIAMTNPKVVDASKLPVKPVSSVVLIDEIDKAPRDFTNDILHEIEEYNFSIKEQDNYGIKSDEGQQIVVIMTSNSEKNLPDAFLRRCIFYHIPFPSDEILLEIVQSQLGSSTKYTEAALTLLINKFNEVRKGAVRKPPATAEFISWLRILELQNYLEKEGSEQRDLMLKNLSILVKTKVDLDAVKGIL